MDLDLILKFSGVVGVIIGYWWINPFITEHKTNKGLSLSELIDGDNRVKTLSNAIYIIAILTSIYYLHLIDNSNVLNSIAVFLLILSSIFLIFANIFDMQFSLKIHNFFAKGFVGIHITGATLLANEKLISGFNIFAITIVILVIVLTLKIFADRNEYNFPLKSINAHINFMYSFVLLTLGM